MHYPLRSVPLILASLLQMVIGTHGVMGANAAEPMRGLLIVNDRSTSREFSPVYEIVGIDVFGATYKARLAGKGGSLSGLSGTIVQVVHYPSVAEDLVGDSGVKRLQLVTDEFRAVGQKFEKARPFTEPVIRDLTQQMSLLRAGNVRTGGKWIAQADYQRAQATQNAGMVASLGLNGQNYKGVRLLSAKDGVVTLAHDGGVARVPLASLQEADKRMLASVLHIDLAKASTVSAAPGVGMPAAVTQVTPAVTSVPFSMPGLAGASATPARTTPSPIQPIIEINATGVGTTADEALRDAFRDATHRAVGAFISAEQIVKNEELLRDQVIAHSDGFIQGYDKTSEKQEQGLFRVAIRARVVRAKLAQQLSKSGLIGKTEVEGESMFAEAVTKLDKAKAAKELLAKLFEGFPQSVCRATLIGKPTIVSQDATTATLRLRIRVGVDAQAYATWHQNAVTVLRQVCQNATPFLMPRDEVDQKEYTKTFGWRLYTFQDPSENDDIKAVRFNTSLDGLIPIQRQNKMPIDAPRSGMRLFLSKSLDGFSGDAYLLGEDEYQSITTALTEPHGRSESKWHVLDSIKVEFKDAADQKIMNQRLMLYQSWHDQRFQQVINWPAPYGTIKETSNQYGKGLEIQDGGIIDYEANRMILIRPGFILDHMYGSNRIESSRKHGPSWVVVATAGAAVDFKVTVPLEEMRKFHHIELSLELPQK